VVRLCPHVSAYCHQRLQNSKYTYLLPDCSRNVEKLTPDITPQPPTREGGAIKASLLLRERFGEGFFRSREKSDLLPTIPCSSLSCQNAGRYL
jgi:hypothetical protein